MAVLVLSVRAGLADGARWWVLVAFWFAAVIAVLADLLDPLRPETIRHPQGWAFRVFPVSRPAPDAPSGPSEP